MGTAVEEECPTYPWIGEMQMLSLGIASISRGAHKTIEHGSHLLGGRHISNIVSAESPLNRMRLTLSMQKARMVYFNRYCTSHIAASLVGDSNEGSIIILQAYLVTICVTILTEGAEILCLLCESAQP